MRRTVSFVILLVLFSLTHSVFASFPEDYYKDVNGKNKSSLKAALHKIIKTADVLDYGKGEGGTWSGFYVTDRTEDNYCIDRYSTNKRQFSSTTAAPSGMNIEHSFAKSWWEGGERMQAYFDLFNLMPSDSEANSKKSNYAMGEVVRNISYDNGSIKIGNSNMVSNRVWEPEDKWKGDFARTYMYMITCYSDYTWRSNGLDQLENNQWPTFNEWTREMVLRWSRQDPVDEIEIARNEAIYEIQGNRNPYVDFPNLCEYVWGDSVDYPFDANTSVKAGQISKVLLLDETLTDGLGVFSDTEADGTEGSLWRSDSRYGAVANAYNAGKIADNYLMAEVDLTTCKAATLTFDHQTGYNVGVDVKNEFFYVLVTDDYSETPEATAWETLDAEFPLPPSSGWTETVSSGTVSLDAYAGRKVILAFRYTSNSDACYGWEIRNVKVMGTSISTGIDELEANPVNVRSKKVYDLSGRRVNATQAKGIFVLDGNKYVR